MTGNSRTRKIRPLSGNDRISRNRLVILMGLATLALLFSPDSVHAEIDALIAADCEQHSVPIPAAADDATFLRRVYLDAVGRIPTVAESREFLASTDPEKRGQLIDSLLNSEGYAKHWFHFWADLLRVSTAAEITRSGIVGSAYCEWILQALRENRPYDQMVRDLVGRQGNIWEPENAGAVGFYLRDFAMPLEHFGVLMQIFTGTRMECAQCHDHPFDRWTQMDFHKMAAFTYGVRASKYPAIYEQIKGPDRAAINKITIPMRFASVLPRPYPIKLPHDYAYDDAKPHDTVAAETVFGRKVQAQGPLGSGAESTLFARWLTDPDHPRFTRVIVNRLWDQLFGAPLVPPPLDDLRDDTAAWNPALEAELMQRMIGSDFNLRSFLATVMKSSAYQRVASSHDYLPGERQTFEGPYLRRMSAEQVWDSYATLITVSADRPYYQRRSYRERYLNDLRVRAEKVCNKSPESVRAWLHSAEGRAFVARTGKAPSKVADSLAEQHQAQFRALDDFKDSSVGSKQQFSQWKALHSQLYRASELETPAPPGHFLRTFGQSDRTQANNSSRNSSVPQALALFNSEMTAAVLNPFSTILRLSSSAGDRRSQAETLFLGILTRPPSAAELAIAEQETPDDLAAALLATTEFLFIP